MTGPRARCRRALFTLLGLLPVLVAGGAGPALSGPELERWLERRLESGAPPRRVSWPDAEAHPALRSTRDR